MVGSPSTAFTSIVGPGVGAALGRFDVVVTVSGTSTDDTPFTTTAVTSQVPWIDRLPPLPVKVPAPAGVRSSRDAPMSVRAGRLNRRVRPVALTATPVS